MIRGAIVLFLSSASAILLAQQPPSSATLLRITGHVLAASDDAVLRRARVDVNSGNQRLASVFSDDQGRFAAEVSRGGPFTITVAKGGYAFARTTLSRTDAAVPLTVRLPRGGAIAGRVADQNGAVGVAAPVQARRVDREAPGFPPNFATATDDLGVYRLAGLPAGRYEIVAGRAPSTLPMLSTTAAFLDPGGGQQIFGATVVDTTPPSSISRGEILFSTAGGVTTVIPSPAPPPPPGQTVVVQPGEDVNGIDFFADAEVVISAAGATITGQVTDDKAMPVNEYSVIVFPTQRDKWYPASRHLKLGRPAQDGAFRVDALPPGDYWFAAVDRVDTGGGGEWQSPELLETLVSRASRITLGEGELHRTTLRVIRR